MKGIILISFLLLTQILFAQKPEVELTIEPTNAEVGEVFTITVRSNVEGQIEIDNLPSSFVHGYDVLNGVESEMDYNTGEIITYYYFSQTGAIGKKGKYTIGPAYIKKGNKTYPSNTVDIEIGGNTPMVSTDVSSDQLNNPAFGIIETNKKTIYEGEPIVVAAKIFSRFEPTHLEGYQTYEIPGTIDKAKIAGGKRIIVEREKFKNEVFYAFEYDKSVIFPTGTGDLKILPFTMKLNQNFKGYQFKSNAAIVHIKPLPDGAPNDFIGGVGEFSIDRKIDSIQLQQGDVFKMIVTVKGKGNIQNTVEPTLHLPKGFIVYGDPEIEENYSFNSTGAEGEISYAYNIQVNNAGEVVLPSTSISYFDPKQEKYVTLQSSPDTLTIKKDPTYISQVDSETENDNELMSEDFEKSQPSDKESFVKTPIFGCSLEHPSFLLCYSLFLSEKEKMKTTKRNPYEKNEKLFQC